MRFLILLAFTVGPLIPLHAQDNLLKRVSNELTRKQRKIHFRSILVDTHNDIPYTALEKNLSFDQHLEGRTHSDLARMQSGGVDAQFFSIWCDGETPAPYALANRQIDTVLAWTNRNPDKMMACHTTDDIRRAVKQKKLGVLLGVEGGHMIEDDITKLDALYQRGVRYMTLTWNNSTSWASSAFDEETRPATLAKKGLNDFGKQVVRRMNELGMMVDLSHVGEQTFYDAIAVSTRPVLVSHSCAYALCDHRRNLKDDQLKALARNGGVIQVNFYSGFVDPLFETKIEAFLERHKAEADSLKQFDPTGDFMHRILFARYPKESSGIRPPLSMLLDHIDYIARLIGVDHVGLGSDFDGINSTPLQLESVTDYPLITRGLLLRGYSKKEIKKILGGNLLRVMKANQANVH